MSEYEDIAKTMHEAYERLAPEFGYTTRSESAVPWEMVPKNSRALMVAAVTEAVSPLLTRVAELEARAEHDEDNLEGLQHALVRANQQYTQAEVALAERDRTVGRLKATIGILRAHIDDGTEKCSVCRGVIAGYDLRARAEEGSG